MKTPFISFILALFISVIGNSASLSDLRKFETATAQNPEIITKPALIFNQKNDTLVFENLEYTVLSKKEFLSLESQLRLKNYANAYKKDGCYAKSHLISYELYRVGIKHNKILIFGNELGDVQVTNPDHSVILFKFHIAPIVLVREIDNSIMPYVLDLTFFDKAPHYDAWIDLFYKNSIKDKVTIQIAPPQSIDPTWQLPIDMTYSPEYLYRFENEVKAINSIRP